ncbi:MAG: hypothetical protein ACN6O2_05100 [Stenotrophomonas sp.]
MTGVVVCCSFHFLILLFGSAFWFVFAFASAFASAVAFVVAFAVVFVVVFVVASALSLDSSRHSRVGGNRSGFGLAFVFCRKWRNPTREADVAAGAAQRCA